MSSCLPKETRWWSEEVEGLSKQRRQHIVDDGQWRQLGIVLKGAFSGDASIWWHVNSIIVWLRGGPNAKLVKGKLSDPHLRGMKFLIHTNKQGVRVMDSRLQIMTSIRANQSIDFMLMDNLLTGEKEQLPQCKLPSDDIAN